MKLDRDILDKIDPLLQDKLANAPEDEILRVIMRLGTDNETDPITDLTSISPTDFESSIEYRKAIIALRQKQLSEEIGPIKKELENLDLKIYGGVNTPSLVVEGTVNKIWRSLELSGVRSASLDRSFIAIDPHPNSIFVNELKSIFLEIAEKAEIGTVKTPLARSPVLKNSNLSLEENTKELIDIASQQYGAKYALNYGTLQVLGMRNPLSLEYIYTTVRLLSKRDIVGKYIKSIEQLEKETRKKINYELSYAPERSGIDIANQEQRLMVFGAPGSGKSTFLKRIALEAFKGKRGNYEHLLIPVFLELKRFNKVNIDVTKKIAKEFESCGFTSAEKYTKIALEKGKLLVILDGLDEVPTKNLERAIEQIHNFVDRYNKNRFIISSRTALNRSFANFTEVVIADFNDTQIEQFIFNWFQSEKDRQAKTAEKCWNSLQGNESIKNLAKTPLLLTFLCLVYSRSQTFPSNRRVLYGKALIILLEEWAAEKRIIENEIYQGLNTELEIILLSEIAYNSFVKDRLFLKKEEITGQIESFLADNLNAPQQLNGEAVLNAIEVQQGILVAKTVDIYSFSHLTLQEYLTAQYIDDNHLIKDLVSNHLTDIRWQEVFLLVAGLMRGGADELLLLMEQEAQNYLKTYIGKKRLVPLLRWANKITAGSKSTLKPVAKRATALAIIHGLAYSRAVRYIYPFPVKDIYWIGDSYAQQIFNIFTNIYINNYFIRCEFQASEWEYEFSKIIDCNCRLEKAEIFTNINLCELNDRLEAFKGKVPSYHFIPEDISRKFLDRIIETFLNAFQLTPELVNLSEKELKEIDDNYFYINLLMVECKETAVKISPKTWQGIEERMFLV